MGEGLEDMIDWPRYTLGARTLDMYFADRSHLRTLMRRRGHFAAWGMWIFPLWYWLAIARQQIFSFVVYLAASCFSLARSVCIQGDGRMVPSSRSSSSNTVNHSL